MWVIISYEFAKEKNMGRTNKKKITFMLLLSCVFALIINTVTLERVEPTEYFVYANESISETSLESLQASYDPRGEDFLTDIKNQGQLGLCWAYAFIDSIEINLKKNFNTDNRFDDINLSERDFAFFAKNGIDTNINSLTYGDGADLSGSENLNQEIYNSGGSFEQSIFTALAGWGLVEQDYTENTTSVANYTSGMQTGDEQDARRYGDIVSVIGYTHYSADVEGAQDLVKQTILNNGSVLACVKMDNSETYVSNSYSTAIVNGSLTHNFYIAPGKYTSTDHMITIVGWDDNYSRTNFSTKLGHSLPTSDGAWLVKNSWGTSWSNGDSGYIWISYEDFGINMVGYYSIELEEYKEKNCTYGYDAGYSTMISFDVGVSITAGNVFYNATAEQRLRAVGYYIPNSGENYLQSAKIEIYVSDSKMSNPRDGTKVLTLTDEGSVYSGFRYVQIDSSNNILIEKGQYFSVITTISSSDGAPMIAAEGSNGNSVVGCSYLYNGGWVDIGKPLEGKTNYGNVGIKAYTTKTDCVHEFQFYKKVEGDCSHYGYTINQCKYCDEVQIVYDTEYGEHNKTTKHFDGTCIEKGYTSTNYCDICGTDFSTEDTDRVYDTEYGEHCYEHNRQIEGDCQHYTTQVDKCIYCGDEIQYQLAELGYGDHHFERGETVDGVTRYECIINGCDQYYVETDTSNADLEIDASAFSTINFKYGDFDWANSEEILCKLSDGNVIINRQVFDLTGSITSDSEIKLTLYKLTDEEIINSLNSDLIDKLKNIIVYKFVFMIDGTEVTNINGNIKLKVNNQIDSQYNRVIYVENESSSFAELKNGYFADGDNLEIEITSSGLVIIGAVDKPIFKFDWLKKEYIYCAVVIIAVLILGEIGAGYHKKRKIEE